MNSPFWAVLTAQGEFFFEYFLAFSCGQIFFFDYLKKYCSVRTKKLHNISFIKKINFNFFVSKWANTQISIVSVKHREAL